MLTFTCWCEEAGAESYRKTLEGYSADGAAEQYASLLHAEMDYFTELHVFAQATDGSVTSWDVEARQVVQFRASPRQATVIAG